MNISVFLFQKEQNILSVLKQTAQNNSYNYSGYHTKNVWSVHDAIYLKILNPFSYKLCAGFFCNYLIFLKEIVTDVYFISIS